MAVDPPTRRWAVAQVAACRSTPRRGRVHAAARAGVGGEAAVPPTPRAWPLACAARSPCAAVAGVRGGRLRARRSPARASVGCARCAGRCRAVCRARPLAPVHSSRVWACPRAATRGRPRPRRPRWWRRRGRRGEQREEASRGAAVALDPNSPERSAAVIFRPCQSTRASVPGSVSITASGPPRLRGRSRAPVRDAGAEALRAEPQLELLVDAGRRRVEERLEGEDGESTPSRASPSGNGARLPQAPSPRTTGSSSRPHSVSS